MSSGGEEAEVRIKGIKVRLPVYGSVETTRRIAETVAARLDDIEAEGGPINTIQYALRAACDAQHALEELHAQGKSETRELLRRLDRLQSRLEELGSEIDTD